MSGPTVEFSLVRAKAEFWPATFEMMLRARPMVIVVCALIVVLTTLWVGHIFWGEPDMLQISLEVFVGMSLYCCVIWLGVCYVAARRGARAPGALAETRYVFSPEDIFGQSAVITSTTSWDYWKSVLETSRNLYIFSRSGLWMFFPKSALSPETLNAIRELARTHLKPSKTAGSAP